MLQSPHEPKVPLAVIFRIADLLLPRTVTFMDALCARGEPRLFRRAVAVDWAL